MTNIPDELILRAFENAVKGDGQLDDAEIAGKMAAVCADDLYYLFSELIGKIFQFYIRQRA